MRVSSAAAGLTTQLLDASCRPTMRARAAPSQFPSTTLGRGARIECPSPARTTAVHDQPGGRVRAIWLQCTVRGACSIAFRKPCSFSVLCPGVLGLIGKSVTIRRICPRWSKPSLAPTTCGSSVTRIEEFLHCAWQRTAECLRDSTALTDRARRAAPVG